MKRLTRPGWIRWRFDCACWTAPGVTPDQRRTAVGGAHRQAAVLARVAEKAGWGGRMPKDVGLGVATTFGQERDMPTWVACVARVRVDRTSGHVTVEKLTLVIDAGTVIQPDSADGPG